MITHVVFGLFAMLPAGFIITAINMTLGAHKISFAILWATYIAIMAATESVEATLIYMAHRRKLGTKWCFLAGIGIACFGGFALANTFIAPLSPALLVASAYPLTLTLEAIFIRPWRELPTGQPHSESMRVFASDMFREAQDR